MNLLSSIYCYLHHERMKEGKQPSSYPMTGNILTSLSIVMMLLGIFFLAITIFPNFGDDFLGYCEDLFGRGQGQLIGQLLMMILLAVFFPIIKMTIGTPSNFERIKNDFLQMSPKEQEATAQKGKIFFLVSVLLMIGGIFLNGISSLL